jgi:hypothetical protein
MVSRERLLRLGASVAERATARRVRVLAQILLVAAIVFVVLRVRSLWHGSHVVLGNVDWAALAGSFALAALGTTAAALIWLTILDALGVRPKLRWAWLFFQAQLGKYIPGSIWQYAGRAAVARANGIPVRPVGVSLPIEFAALAIAAGAMSGFLLGWWGGLILAAVAVALASADLTARDRRAAFATIRATLLYLPIWLLLGASGSARAGASGCPRATWPFMRERSPSPGSPVWWRSTPREVSVCARPCSWRCSPDGSAPPTHSSSPPHRD